MTGIQITAASEARATIARAELAGALGFAAKALPKRPVVPVLAGLRVSVTAGVAEFAAFDYEMSARALAEAETDGTASVLVNGPALVDAVKALPKGKRVTAVLTVSADGVTIECDGARYTVAGMGEEAEKEYPQLPVMPEAAGVADAEVFARSALRVAACAGTDGTLPVLMHVRMVTGAGLVTLAATDRYRLAFDDMPWTGYGRGGTEILVPAVHLVTFAKACDKGSKVYVAAGEAVRDEHGVTVPALVGFTDGIREMIVHSYSGYGEFPKVDKMLQPESEDETAILADAAKLAATVARVGKMCERNMPVTVDLTPSGLVVTANRGGKPAATETVPATYSGPVVTMGFNPAYLASVLAGVTGEARIGIIHPHKTATVRGTDGYAAVIMPIKLQA